MQRLGSKDVSDGLQTRMVLGMLVLIQDSRMQELNLTGREVCNHFWTVSHNGHFFVHKFPSKKSQSVLAIASILASITR